MTNKKIQNFTHFSMYAAIIFLLAFTPFGFIQLGFIKATIIHIPVIVGSILLGPRMGAALGFLFGVTSLISNTTLPALSSFAFSPFIPVPGTSSGSFLAIIICFLPRILVGVVPFFVVKLLKYFSKKEPNALHYGIAGIAGSLTNTLLVMHLIYFLFKDAYAQIQSVSADAVYAIVYGIIFANGVPEAILAGVISATLCTILTSLNTKTRA